MTIELSGGMREIPINPIRHARVKHGLTQTQLANLTGIPMRNIQNWETGDRKCPVYVEKLILEKLDRLDQPDYQTILEEVLDMMERDLKYLKTDEARDYVSNVIRDIKWSLKE